MTDDDGLAEAFGRQQPRLRAIAQRMLGPSGEADDVVQEAWLRLHRTDGIDDLGRWLTTVVSRLCLDVLRRRATRREEPIEDIFTDAAPASPASADPAIQAEMADAVGGALLVVLDSLQPAERLAFVLHDLFGVPFDQVASLVDRSPDAARQLASRARRRVRGGSPTRPADPARHAQIVAAFLAASRNGDLERLITMLDPQAVLRSGESAVRMGAPDSVLGADAVAQMFSGSARSARPALLDGVPGVVWAQGGVPRMAFHFTFVDDRVALVEMEAAPDPSRVEMLTMSGAPLPVRPVRPDPSADA
jgi:RNA polymerase sigma-70 factor (ECF subfamily)